MLLTNGLFWIFSAGALDKRSESGADFILAQPVDSCRLSSHVNM